MIRHLLTAALLAISPVIFAQTNIPGGNVSGTWTTSGSPYLVQGSIMVPLDSTLTIQAGVIVNFQGHYKFLVLGRLLAIGTETAIIDFMTDNISTGWWGLRFDHTSNSNDSSILEYCKVRFGRAVDPEHDAGGIRIDHYSKVRISHCQIQNNYATGYGSGIYCFYSNPVIRNNTFKSNGSAGGDSYGGAIFCDSSSPLILENWFESNEASVGGAIFCSNSNALISGNTFYANGANRGGALRIMTGSPVISGNIIIENITNYSGGCGAGIYLNATATIINNTISNNIATGNDCCGGGLYIAGNDASTILNNTITNNTADYSNDGLGGGIYFSGHSSTTLTNNTIANNLAGQSGGAAYFYSSLNPVFRNCIIYGNVANGDQNQVYLYDEPSDPDFFFCDIQGGVAGFNTNGNFYTGVYSNNIDQNPVLVWPSAGSGYLFNGETADWSESQWSPCINAGDPSGTYPDTDKQGNPRVVDGRVDIGAYEYQWPVGTNPRLFQNQASAVPNPAVNFTIIHFNDQISYGSLKIFDSYGKSIRSLSGISGDHVRIERENLPAGYYLYEILEPGKPTLNGKLIFIDELFGK